MKLKVSSAEDINDALREAVSDLNLAFDGEIDASLSDVSKMAFEKAKELAAARLHKTKQQYIDALSLERVGPNIYAVRLDESAVHLEEGYNSYDMKPGLLHLHKGYTDLPKGMKGSNSGIRMSKDGYRYRAIPMEKDLAQANSSNPQANTPYQFAGRVENGQMKLPMGQGIKQALANNAKKVIKSAWGDKPVVDAHGKPVIGAAGTVTPHPMNRMKGLLTDPGGNKRVVDLKEPMHQHNSGITRMQYEEKTRSGKTRIKSAYLTFRMVSENPKHAGKWIHPGFNGAHIMEDVQRWTEEQFARMVDEIFRKAVA